MALIRVALTVEEVEFLNVDDLRMHKRLNAILSADTRISRVILLDKLLMAEDLPCHYGPHPVEHLLLDSPDLPVLSPLQLSSRLALRSDRCSASQSR